MHIERCRAAALAGLLLMGSSAARAETSPWSLGASVAVTHDNNLFRVPADQAVGDRYTTLALQGALDQSISRQHLQLSAALRDNHYEQRSDLDYRGYGLQLGWNGATAGALSWTLGYAANRNLAAFGSSLTPAGEAVANIETSRQASAGLQLGLVSEWVASVSLNHRTLDYSAPAFAPDSFNQDSIGVGLQWRPLGPLSVTLGPRSTRGRYPQARTLADGTVLADGFDRQDLDLTVGWAASGASQLGARLSLSRQRYKLLSDRDFSGATGQLSWQWQASGLTSLVASLSRDTGSETSFFTVPSFGQVLRGTGDAGQLTTSLYLGANRLLTGKTSMDLSASYVERRLVSSSSVETGVGSVELGNLSGTERSGSLGLALHYAPSRSTQLSCELGHGRRAGVPGLSLSYRYTTLGCSGQLTLR